MERVERAEYSCFRKVVAKITRVITIPPIMAAILCTLLFCVVPDAFSNGRHYFSAIVFLVLLPLSAYPLSMIIPSLRRGGRSSQRTLSIVFSVAGYMLGAAFAFIAGGTDIEKTLFLTYLLSGVFTALCSFVFKFRASGHACGVSGPVAMLVHYLGAPYMLGFLLLIAVFVSSLRLKRHTLAQLIGGSAIPILSMYAALLIVSWLTGI